MTLTDTVTSIAHDAAHTASGLGKQAVEFGRTAAEAAADAASSAASTAQQFVNNVTSKVPTVTVKPAKKTPWRLIIIGAMVTVVAGIYWKSRKASPASSGYSSLETAGDPTRPVAIRKTA